MQRDLGDFQTPRELADLVFGVLDRIGVRGSLILEPTCGRGSFLEAARERHAEAILLGIEIQPDHVRFARALVPTARIIEGDIFDPGLDLTRLVTLAPPGPLLVVGNPPWITVGELGRLDSKHQPPRRTDLGLRGFDALTGRSNFDLAEAVWYRLFDALKGRDATLALLCKESVALRVMATATERRLPIKAASFHRIDSRRWFGASVSAGLFRVELGRTGEVVSIDHHPTLMSEKHDRRIGTVDGVSVHDLDAFCEVAEYFGSPVSRWRQGIKHDAADVLELRREGAHWINGYGDRVDVEPSSLYPLLKSVDLNDARRRADRALIVPQLRLGDSTEALAESHPRLWRYLQSHSRRFEARRSRIYAGRTPFSIFGVGPYSFQPHKVAVSGLHVAPRFQAIEPVEGRPVVFDDTCYFLPVDSSDSAHRVVAALESESIRRLLAAVVAPGSKRKVTKRLLDRIDHERLLAAAT